MTLRPFRVPAVTLAAIVAASVFVGACARPAADPLALHDDGIGPLVLGRDYGEAVAAAGRVAPDSMLAGPGCGELDEVRYNGHMGEFPVSLMAMADEGVLVEVELGLDAPLTAPDEAACLAMRDRFAEPFVARFGQPAALWELDKPVSREHRVRTGPVVVVARWFPTGRSCYISVHYGRRESE